MKKQYEGLYLAKVEINHNDILTASVCVPMIQLQMVDGVCVSDPSLQQIEYVGDKG